MMTVGDTVPASQIKPLYVALPLHASAPISGAMI